MDFLSRLIAGSGSSPTKQRVNSPAERLAVCKKICGALQQIWRTSRFEDDVTSAYVANYLKRLNAILSEESRKAAPHSCLLYTASSQVYIIVAKLSSQDAEIVRAAAQFFHLLVHGEVEEGVLDSKIFARSLTDLVKKYVTNRSIILDKKAEEELVERLFEVATKIKLDPDLLPAWFYPERDRSRPREALGEARKNQFPLFYLLVEYVHHDGATGDFARTALLYLTETASKSKPLELWMIESDLAPQMASGLGALYSRLSRSLPQLSEGDTIPPIIALSDASMSEKSDPESAAASQQDVKAYLSYLAFWQDTLNYCKSPEVSDTLLDHFQVLFVQQLLYPSLLESSDVDGGSTASVLTHLFRTLVTLENPDLVDRILKYLLAAPNPVEGQRLRKPHKRMSMSRRKSIDQLAAFVEKTSKITPAPDLFTLADLMIMSLKSKNPRTVVASLKLVSVITSKHHQHAALFKTWAAPSARRLWKMQSLTAELTKLLGLATTITNSGSIDQSYQGMLSDVQTKLEEHSCSREILPNANHPDYESCLIMSGDCKIFAEVFTLLKSFFGNDTATNLALTETIMSIACCRQVIVQGWLLPSPQKMIDVDYQSSNILLVLADHIKQILVWRAQFPDWDELMAQRRVDLMEDESPAQNVNMRSISGKSDRSYASNTTSSFAQSSKVSSSQPSSRPTTPQGRKFQNPEFGSIDSALSASPPIRALANSPLRQAKYVNDAVNETETRQTISLLDVTALLQTQVSLPYQEEELEVAVKPSLASLVERMKITGGGEAGSAGTSEGISSGAVTPSLDRGWERSMTSASLSHVLTNAVILQEFILEVAAVVQVRASLFGEVEAE